MLPFSAFYGEYYGHTVEHLSVVVPKLREQHKRLVFLAGDSSLDNKHWVKEVADPINGYEQFVANSTCDVAYWINHELSQHDPESACVNCAVEESTLRGRTGLFGSLHPQDNFIRDNLQQNDDLIISVGGNDIGLSPSPATIVNMLMLIRASPEAVRAGTAWGMSHFIDLFSTKVEEFVRLLTQKTKPRRVLACMLYYLDEKQTGSWADGVLSKLKYDVEPARLKLIISEIFRQATSRVRVEGVEIIPVPLFEIMDGTDTRDYVARVEPSSQGGAKMAKGLVQHLVSARGSL